MQRRTLLKALIGAPIAALVPALPETREFFGPSLPMLLNEEMNHLVDSARYFMAGAWKTKNELRREWIPANQIYRIVLDENRRPTYKGW